MTPSNSPRLPAALCHLPFVVRLLRPWAVSLILACGAFAASTAKKPFDLPAGDAARTLRSFSEQSGEQIIFPVEQVRGVKTNAVRGQFATREALDQMLAGTKLRAVEDKTTGALAVQRDNVPNGSGAAPAVTKSGPPSQNPKPEAEEETIRLNTFVVQADRSESYSTLNTNSITRFRTELTRMPISADIYTESFMQDVGATDVESMLEQYSPAGFGGANPAASGQGLGRPGDFNAQSTTTLRGLATGENMTRRNGFLPHWGPNDNYYLERVEVIRGPQALLYGAGSAGGVVNNVAKQARFGASFGEVQFRFAQHGSLRSTLDYGRSFGPVAVRVAGLVEDSNYARMFTGQKQNAGYVQLAFQLSRNHVVRVSADRLFAEQSLSQPSLILLAPKTGALPADPRNNQHVRLLLAQGMAGDLVNGKVNWDTVDSFAGEYAQQRLSNDHVEVLWESKWTGFLSTQLSYGYDAAKLSSVISSSSLYAPGLGGNPTGDWAMAFGAPGDNKWWQYNKGVRVVATGEFDALRGHHQLIAGGENNKPDARYATWRYYELDANGNTIVNPNLRTNANLGRNQLSNLQLGNSRWVPVGAGPVFAPFAGLDWHPFQNRIAVNGTTYERQWTAADGVSPATPGNPRGTGGSGTWQYRDADRSAYFAAGLSTWLGRRLTTLYGLRYDEWDDVNYNLAAAPQVVSSSQGHSTSYNLGANYRITEGLHAYYGYSVSYKNNLSNQAPDGSRNPPISRGKGHEIGLKFNLFEDRVSGSVGYYNVKSVAENFLLPGTFRDAVNPTGINGRVDPSNNWIGVDRVSDGVELVLTAQPAKNWRSRLNFGVTDGTIGETRSFPILYNDQFHTDARGGVIFEGGQPLMVKVDPQDKSANAPMTQLTVAMMNDAASPYFADLDPDSGRIRNASFLGLTGTNSAGASVGTGVVGLPISRHQLRFTDPNGHNGSIPAVKEGLPTTSYAKYSLSWTNNYSFADGMLKGLSVGGTIRYKGENRSYYYSNVVLDAAGKPQSELTLFSLPDATYVDFSISYGFRLLGKARCSVQLNIQNAFDEYKVVQLPNSASGVPQMARLSTEPRFTFLTTRFSF